MKFNSKEAHAILRGNDQIRKIYKDMQNNDAFEKSRKKNFLSQLNVSNVV